MSIVFKLGSRLRPIDDIASRFSAVDALLSSTSMLLWTGKSGYPSLVMDSVYVCGFEMILNGLDDGIIDDFWG